MTLTSLHTCPGLVLTLATVTFIQTLDIYGLPYDNHGLISQSELNFSSEAISGSTEDGKSIETVQEYLSNALINNENNSLIGVNVSDSLANNTKNNSSDNINLESNFIENTNLTAVGDSDSLKKSEPLEDFISQADSTENEEISAGLELKNDTVIPPNVISKNISLESKNVTLEASTTDKESDVVNISRRFNASSNFHGRSSAEMPLSSSINVSSADVTTFDTTIFAETDGSDINSGNSSDLIDTKPNEQAISTTNDSDDPISTATTRTEPTSVENHVENFDHDLGEYYRRTQRCLKEISADIQWDTIKSGQIAIKNCMKGYVGKAYRMCYHSGRWGQVDRLDCQIELLEKVRKLIYQHFEEKMIDGIGHLASDMLRVLQSYPVLSISDILEGLDTLNDILMSRSVIEQLVINSDEAWNFYQKVMQIIDILFGSIKEKVEDESVYQMVALKVLVAVEKMNKFGTSIAANQTSTSHGNPKTKTFGSAIALWKNEKDYVAEKNWNKNAIGGVNQDLYHPIDWESSKCVVRTVSWFGKQWSGQLKDQTYAVNSAIVSVTATVLPSKIHKMNNKFTFVLYKTNLEQGYGMKCGFLRNSFKDDIYTYRGISIWDTDGCHMERLNKSTVTCHCSAGDLGTPTAVLILQEDDQKAVTTHRMANVVYLGCLISLAAVILTFLSHICVDRAKVTGSVMIMLNLVVSVAASQVIFMAGIQATSNQEVCESVAILLHYSYLVTSFWLFSHTINMYMLQKSNNQARRQ